MKLETKLDRFLIKEIPVENARSLGIVTAAGQEIISSEKSKIKPFLGEILSCDAKFPFMGALIENPYRVGDIVKTNEFGRDYLTIDPFRNWSLIKVDDQQYYFISYADIDAKVVNA